MIARYGQLANLFLKVSDLLLMLCALSLAIVINYAPEASVEVVRILDRLYGIDALHPPQEVWRVGGLARDSGRAVWEKRTAEITDDAGKVIGRPAVSLVGTKEEAKQQAKTLARSLGLKVYGIVDKTGGSEEPHPWLVPGVGKAL